MDRVLPSGTDGMHTERPNPEGVPTPARPRFDRRTLLTAALATGVGAGAAGATAFTRGRDERLRGGRQRRLLPG
ncbi:hypothetical protein, partial [Kitasatospora sp. NPDC004289]